MSSTVIRMKNIYKKYNNNVVLENINIQVQKKEIVGIVGPNGAGKTTLFKLLSNLIRQTSGEIEIEGNIGGTISKTPLYPFLTGKDHLKYIAKLNSITDTSEIEKFICIGNYINNKVSTYSLGMKQRLSLGLTLLSNSSIILLDEPTNGLDYESSIELIKTLKTVSSDLGKTILISSHNLNEIDKLCNKVVFLNKGKIINILNKDESNISNKYTITFYTNNSEFLQSISKLDNTYIENNKFIKTNCDENTINNILKNIYLNNIQINNLLVTDKFNNIEESYNFYINERTI